MGIHISICPQRIVGIKSRQQGFRISLLQEIYMDTPEQIIPEKGYFSNDIKGGSSK
jgi:hypothetical protein